MPEAFKPIDMSKAQADRVRRDAEMKRSYDKNLRSLPALSMNDRVLCQDVLSGKWNREGKIIEVIPDANSYVVEFLDGGRALRRNRRFLRRL